MSDSENPKTLTGTEKLNWLEDYAERRGIGIPYPTGLEDAIIGVTDVNSEPVIIMSYWGIIEILISRDGMDVEEAQEFFDYNIDRPENPFVLFALKPGEYGY